MESEKVVLSTHYREGRKPALNARSRHKDAGWAERFHGRREGLTWAMSHTVTRGPERPSQSSVHGSAYLKPGGSPHSQSQLPLGTQAWEWKGGRAHWSGLSLGLDTP